jgi:hypothetical protein
VHRPNILECPLEIKLGNAAGVIPQIKAVAHLEAKSTAALTPILANHFLKLIRIIQETCFR